MLGVLRISAVMIGAAAGALVSGVVFLLGVLLARLVGASDGPPVVLTVSLLTGLIFGGFLAGRLAPVNGRFHGSVTGLAMATVVVVLSILGGSPAPTSQVALLALIAIILGGAAGWFGGRRRYNGNREPAG